MPTPAQLQKVLLLSDTVFYPEAVAFMQSFVKGDFCQPLPTSQTAGLLNIAEALKYDELRRFVVHQGSRDWPPSKRYIKTFYMALEEQLTSLRNRLVRDEFHLLTDGQGHRIVATSQDADLLMARLAREYIQHLVAENGLLDAKAKAGSQRQQPNRR